jgi:hypothetical protein
VRLVVLTALAACSSFQPIQPNICGNGILEDGEDCDDPKDPRCVACSLTCTSDSECMDVPAPRDGNAYLCGWDQPTRLCHAPGGKFGSVAGVQPFDVLGFGIVDVNGDHIGDATGLSKTHVVARYGDASGQLALSSQAVMPQLLGAPAIHDVNGDGAVDLTIPTQDGLLAFTGAHGTMVPYTFALSFAGPMTLVGLRAVKLDNRYMAVFFDQSGVLTVSTLDIIVSNAPQEPVTTPLCDGAIDAHVDPNQISAYDVTSVYGTPAIMFAIEAPRANSTTRELCAMTIVETSPGTFAVNEVTPPGAVVAGGPAVLAQLEPGAAGCPSLVLADRSRYPGSNATGKCQLGAQVAPLAIPPGIGDPGPPIGHVPLQPPIANRASDALVLLGGIAAYDTTNHVLDPLYESDVGLSMVTFGDVDGDSKLDAIVAGANATDLDVLYRVTAPTDGFLRLRIPTDSAIKLVMAGDFDGNGLADVLAVGHVATLDPTKDHDSVVIAYGTRDQVLPPIEVGEFDNVVSLSLAQLVDSVDQTGTVDDLAVVDRRGANATVLGLLHGTPQRELLPYFDPRPGTLPPALAPWQTSAFAAVIVGDFFMDSYIDLIAIEVKLAGSATIWRLVGAGKGAISAPFVSQLLPGAALCPEGVMSTAQFCVNGTVFVPWSSGNGQIVIGLDHITGNAVVIDPSQFDLSMGPPPFSGLTTTPVVPPLVRQLQPPVTIDTDNDGVNELIFAYVDRAGSGGVKSCTVSGTTLDCSRDLLANTGLDPTTCTGVAKGAVTPEGQGTGDSLVLECGSTFYRLDYDKNGYHATALLTVGFQLTQFGLGDVTGDLVPDLLLEGSDNGVPTLFVYPQCTSRGCP